MGLERMTAVLQGTHDNYNIDHFKKIMSVSADLLKSPINDKTIASHRVIADHLRASSFLIAEGILPSNEGRGYVLRRIMRRGMRHAHTLGGKETIFYKLFVGREHSCSNLAAACTSSPADLIIHLLLLHSLHATRAALRTARTTRDAHQNIHNPRQRPGRPRGHRSLPPLPDGGREVSRRGSDTQQRRRGAHAWRARAHAAAPTPPPPPSR